MNHLHRRPTALALSGKNVGQFLSPPTSTAWIMDLTITLSDNGRCPDQPDKYRIVTGGSVAEWLARWTHARKAWVQIAAATLSANSLRQTVRTHRASVHQAVKLLAALLRVARITAGLAESNGSLPPGL